MHSAQADLVGGELVGDRSGVGQGRGQAVRLGHHEGVTGAGRNARYRVAVRTRLCPTG